MKRNRKRGKTFPPERSRTVTDQPSLLARIDRAICRLQNTHGLLLQPLADGCDLLRHCADDHVHMRRALRDLREAVFKQVGNDQASSASA